MRWRRRAYPTDLTGAQGAALAELAPEVLPGGRPRRASSRELINAIPDVLRGGQAWRLLPHGVPPWQTVYCYLRRWQAEGVWERIHHAVPTGRVPCVAQERLGFLGGYEPRPVCHGGHAALGTSLMGASISRLV
jgi:transposase